MARTLAIILLLSLPLAGCFRYRSPDVTVTDARLVETTNEAVRVEFGIHMSNPNSVPLPLRFFQYSATLDGKARFTGKRSAQATLPANGEKDLIIPGVFLISDLAWSPDRDASQIGFAINGRIFYETPGELAEILLDTQLRRPKREFSERGVVQLAGPPPRSVLTE